MAESFTEADPIAGPWLKWYRAKFHFEALNQMIERFYKPDSYTLYAKAYPDQGPTLHVRNVRQPSLKVGVVVGDIVHNLRSALDHLVYELSRPPGGGESPSGTEFPIFLSGTDYKGNGPRDRSSGRYKIRAAKLGTKGIIEGFQPYHRRSDPDLFSLWQLHELSTIDKHRLVHIVTSAAKVTEVRIESSSWNIRYGGYETFTGPLKEDSIIARFDVGKLKDVPSTVDANLTANVQLDIAFDERGPAKSVRGESVLRVLAKVMDLMQFRVIPELRPFLD